MELIDELEGFRVVQFDIAEADQPVWVLGDKSLRLLQVLGGGEKKGDPIDRVELRDQLLQKRRIAVVMHVRVHNARLGRLSA